jgi:hypothetical protein
LDARVITPGLPRRLHWLPTPATLAGWNAKQIHTGEVTGIHGIFRHMYQYLFHQPVNGMTGPIQVHPM